MTAPEVYAPQNAAEAALVAAWPDLAPKLVASARKVFLFSPWRHEAHERAEEKAQDTFVRCLAAAREGRWDGNKVAQYVSVVGHNVVTDTLRQQKWVAHKLGTMPDHVGGDVGGDPTSTYEGALSAAAEMVDHLTPETVALQAAGTSDLRGLLGVAMEAVPARLRHAVWLQVYGGLTLEAIGASLGITATAAKAMLYRARFALEAALRDELAARRRGAGVRVRLAAMTRQEGGASETGAGGGCWEWCGSRSNRSPWIYVGTLRLLGRPTPVRRSASARRVVWALRYGPLPPWLDVRAGCGSAVCTKPACLEAGPRMRLRNRDRSPGRTGAHLGPLDGQSIPSRAALARQRLAAGLTQEQVAAAVGCNPRHVSRMERGTPTKARPGTLVPGRRRPPEQRWLDLRRRVALVLSGPDAQLPEPMSGADLRRRRLALGLDQQALAAEAGCGAATLWRIELEWKKPRKLPTDGGPPRGPVAARSKAKILAALDRLEGTPA